jgi:hypothetical protein
VPINYRDAEDAGLKGWVQVQEFMSEFMQQWTQPIQRMAGATADEMVLRQWDELSPAAIAQLKQQLPPDVFARAEAKIAEIRQAHEKTHPNLPRAFGPGMQP